MANLLRAGLPTLVAALALGCAGAASDPRFDPSESVLEVVAVLRRHVPDDTYRFEPAVDVTGRNVYRASLVRLENLERVHADALRSGYLDDVIAFAKGRALERLRSFELAAEAYRRAAARKGVLEPEALRGAALCDALAEAARIGFDLERPLDAGADAGPASADEALAAFDQRVALLETMAPDVEGSHYAHVVREEIERADMARARWFDAVRLLAPDGNVRALAERQRLVVRHRESRLHNRHLLALANLYADVAGEYVEAHPPEGLLFDSPTFQELAESAARLYEVVANQDGTSEKLEAQQRLEAFLAFTLRVDRDRFTR